jgi:hypothetical protein
MSRPREEVSKLLLLWFNNRKGEPIHLFRDGIRIRYRYRSESMSPGVPSGWGANPYSNGSRIFDDTRLLACYRTACFFEEFRCADCLP